MGSDTFKVGTVVTIERAKEKKHVGARAKVTSVLSRDRMKLELLKTKEVLIRPAANLKACTVGEQDGSTDEVEKEEKKEIVGDEKREVEKTFGLPLPDL